VRRPADPIARCHALATLALALALACGARAEEYGEPGQPILRIETGLHGGAINRVVRAGDDLVTVSDDKTLRRWSLPDGRADGEWRVPIGSGDLGALYAVAVNGKTAVAGGRTGETSYGLYFFDLDSGKTLGTVAGFSQPITALAFADAGALLAVGLQRSGGLEVVDVKSHKVVAVDRDYGGTVNWLAFSATGKLASSAADGKIRLYGGSYAHPAQTQPMPDGDIPWGLAFSPDASMLAVGSNTLAQIGLFLSERLQRVAVMTGTSTSSGALRVVSWNSDGSVLAAAGQYKGGAERNQIRFWPMRGGHIDTTDVVASPDTITDVGFLPDGTLSYVTAQGSFGIVGVDGRTRLSRETEHCDFRDIAQDGFRVATDGSVVDFTCRHGAHDRYRVDFADLSVRPDPPPRGDLAPPLTAAQGIQIDNWRNGVAPVLNGRPLTLDPNEHVRSIAIMPGHAAVVLGTDFQLRLEQPGGEIWHAVLPAPAWAVAATADARYVVAALGDGTICWFDAADGKPAASLFVDARDRRWVIWVPEGFFEHSPGANQGGASLVGFQLNNGRSQAPDFVPGSALYQAFHRRDLVQARLRGNPQDRRLLADELARLGDVRSLVGR
jgi:WD40 repeat protein